MWWRKLNNDAIECIQENVTLPADTLRLDRSDSPADDKTCEDNKEEDAQISSNVVSITEIEADLFTCNKQLHNKEIASEEATSDSELESLPHKQISNAEVSDSENNPLFTTPKRHCKSTKEHAQSSSHTDSDTSHSSNTRASQRTNKRYKSKTHLVYGSHISQTTSTPDAARTLKTRMGKGLAKLFGETDDDIIALDDIRDSIKSKKTQGLTVKYNMLESKVSSRVLRQLSEINRSISGKWTSLP